MPIIWAFAFLLGACGGHPKYPACDGDKDCKTGEKCVNKMCSKCASDTDCPTGQSCVNGGCHAIQGFCNSQADCGGGQTCVNNKCSACSADGQCDSGHCRAGRCLAKGTCEKEEDCPEDEDCVSGMCKKQVKADTSPKCNLGPIYFAFDQFSLSDEAKATLQKDFECIGSETKHVVVIGHADPRGTIEYNIGLSDDRAQAVVTYLSRLGVDPTRMRKVPKGKSEATGTDEASWAKDRRVEFQWE